MQMLHGYPMDIHANVIMFMEQSRNLFVWLFIEQPQKLHGISMGNRANCVVFYGTIVRDTCMVIR
jgi:hypothetical protein